VRLVLSFVVASAFLATGLYVLFLQAFMTEFSTVRGVGFGIVFAFIGGAWLWADFIQPMLRGEKVG
jgi:hypothetical protein